MANHFNIASFLQSLNKSDVNSNTEYSTLDTFNLSINKLSENILYLANVLSRFLPQDTLQQNNSNFGNLNKKSYANVVSGNEVNSCVKMTLATEQTKVVNDKNVPKTNVSDKSLNHSEQPSDLFMQELIKLKNLRVETFYKLQRNIVLKSMYIKNLSNDVKRIPKKFAPTFLAKEATELKNHKISASIQATENEITSLEIHKNIQENKFYMLDKKIREHILTHPDQTKQTHYLNNYENIMKKACDKIMHKLQNKMSFFNSNMYMINIRFFQSNLPTNMPYINLNHDENHGQINVQISNEENEAQIQAITQQNIIFQTQTQEDTDIDDVSEISLIPNTQDTPEAETHEEVNTKRKTSNSFSANFPFNANNSRFIRSTTSSQPVPIQRGKSTRVPNSKNLYTQLMNAKKK